MRNDFGLACKLPIRYQDFFNDRFDINIYNKLNKIRVKNSAKHQVLNKPIEEEKFTKAELKLHDKISVASEYAKREYEKNHKDSKNSYFKSFKKDFNTWLKHPDEDI